MDSPRENHEEYIKDKKAILKSQKKFKSKKHNVFTEEGKIALKANDNKRIQPIDSKKNMHMEREKI